jgi:hypothetical protein
MGYRSDVMALIYPDWHNEEDEREKYEQLKVLMATTFKAVSDEFGDPYMVWMDKDCVLQFTLEGVKWYPSYPDVKMFDQMMAAFLDDIEGYCTEFVRIGEDSDDTEERHTGDNNQYYLRVRRSIDCNVWPASTTLNGASMGSTTTSSFTSGSTSR